MHIVAQRQQNICNQTFTDYSSVYVFDYVLLNLQMFCEKQI